MKKLRDIFVILYILLSLILITLLVMPIDNMIIRDGTIKILNKNKTMKVGQMVHYEVDYIKKYNISAMISKGVEIKNNRLGEDIKSMYLILSTPAGLSSIPAGEHIITASMILPNTNFILGKSKLVFIIEYKLFGGLRTIRDEVVSEEFYIVE